MNFMLRQVFLWIGGFWQTHTIHHRLTAGGVFLVLILSTWNLAEAQRPQRRPARKAPATRPSPPPTPTVETTSPRPLAEYFFADTLLYAEFERLTNAIDEVVAVDSLKSFLAAADSPLPIDLTRYAEALEAFGLPDKATLSATRIGVGLMLAPGQKTSTASPLPVPGVEFVVVLIAPDSAAAARFVRLGEQWLPTLVTNTKRTKPLVGRTGSFRTNTFSAAKAEESLVMAHNGQVVAVGFRPVMTRWLARMTQPTVGSLGKSKGFEEVQKHLIGTRNGLVYINTAAMSTYAYGLFTELLRPSPSAKPVSREQARAEAEFVTKINQLISQSGISAVDGAGYAYSLKDGRFTQSVVVGLDRTSDGLFPAVADGLRVSGRAADFLPSDTQMFATLSVNPTRIYDTLRQMAGTFNAKYETDIQVAERKFAVNFRQEIAAALTGEITLAINDVQVQKIITNVSDSSTLRPFKVATFAVSNNPQALREAFAKIFSAAMRKAANRKAWQAIAKPPEGTSLQPIFDPRTETYAGETIWLFEGINDDPESAFAVSVVANVLVAGRTSDVKWVIDNYRRGQTLGRQEDFNIGFGARPADAMGSVYISRAFLAQLLDELRKETPKRYQAFLEGLTPFPVFIHTGREGRVISSTVDLSLPYLVGIIGAGWGASSGADERQANEQAVREVLRSIYNAQMEYARGDGKGNYSNSLSTLAKHSDGSRALAEEVELMTRLPYRGYVLGPMVVRPAEGNQPAGFHLMAFPAVRTGPDRTGNQTFYLDETGVLRCLPASAGDATADSPSCDSFAAEASPKTFKP
ncbi:MAG: hypothetical protein ACUVR8_00765 [Acidobacteriota bacterium]